MIRISRWTAGATAAALAGTALLLGGPAPASANPGQAEAGDRSIPVRQVSLRLAVQADQAATVSDASQNNDAQVIQGAFTRATNQIWEPDDMGGGYIRFKAVHSGKCLNVKGSNSEDLAEIVQWPCGTDHNEQWKLVPKGVGHQLVARHSGKCLNVKDWVGEGNQLIQYTCSEDIATNNIWLVVTE
ncbi:RICIN domain-containing protein [Streptomyces yaizuensis]|uniref:RICIN domain-containing protein n=1 Tax=Streptomyces yaizuensis TaxID=2989713 RepID=A0ABQ5P0G1_9ACTN|nr:RICIN domain-containing protein [Streptomyces sp. YSPA8]GLF95945.1 RICIN domain-containing protein [Streptomyces sp. YSPA8]